MTTSIKNEWLAELLINKYDLITDYWIDDIRSEGILGYENIKDEQLRKDLPPTVDSMIYAFRTGDTEGPRRHSVGVIQQRLEDGFLLPDLQMSLHSLENAVMRIVTEADVGAVKELEALASASTAYYLIALIAASVYEQLRAEQQRRFTSAYELGVTLSQTLDLKTVLDIAAQKMAEYSGAESAAILLPDQQGELDEVRSSFGLDEDIAGALPSISQAIECISVQEESMTTAQPFSSISDVRTSDVLDRWSGVLSSHFRLSLVCLPLLAKQRRLGNVVLLWRDPHTLSDSEGHFFLALASHVANAVQNAILYEQAKGKRELGVLLEASRLFSSSLETEDVLNRVVIMATEAVRADLAIVLILDLIQQYPRRVAHYNRDDRDTETIRRMIETLSAKQGLDVFGLDFAGGAPLIFSTTESLPLQLQSLLESIGSGMILPIRFKDTLLGAFALMSPNENAFTESDLSLAKALVDLGQIAIENARLYEYERNIAETLQRSFLPTKIPEISGYDTAVYYRPAMMEAEVGGDFYDLFPVGEDKIGIVIGDVSGKGLKAAVSTAMGKYMIRAYAFENPSPDSVMTRFNRTLYDTVPEFSFLTVFYGVLDPKTNVLIYANAGHDPPLLYSSTSRQVIEIHDHGICLGIASDAQYLPYSTQLQPEDVLLLYTDGATDVKQNGDRLEIDGLKSLFLSGASGTAEQAINSISAGVLEFSHGKLADDIAMVVIKRIG